MGKLHRRNTVEIKYCACNKCGLEVKPGRRFISGHNVIVQWQDPEYRDMMVSASNKPETKQKKKDISIALWQDPEYAKMQSDAHIGHPGWNTGLTAETDERVAVNSAKSAETKQKRKKIKEVIYHPCACGECDKMVPEGSRFAVGHNGRGTGKPKSPPQPCWCGCLEMTKPGNRYIKGHSFRGRHHVEESKQKIADFKHAKWQDPEFRKKQLIAMGKGQDRRPNRPESLLQMITREYHPGFKYTGDYSVMINGKNPDFVNEETKQVIEMYGDYWHDGEDPTDRAEIFAQAGYETCVIWENELKNLDHVIGKLNRFTGENQWL